MAYRIHESATLTKQSRVDRVNGLVKGVKLLGAESKSHNRRYTQQAMKNAIHFYEGAKVNFNHKKEPGDRSYESRFGRIRNVTLCESGLFGDLQFNPHHALANQFCWDVDHEPRNVGFSHDATARGKFDSSGVLVIDEILGVKSVDVVADPGTTQSIFESEGKRNKMAIVKVKRKNPKVALQRQLTRLLEAAGDDAPVAPSEPPKMGTAQAMAEMAKSIFLDDSLSPDERKTKIMALLKMEEEADPDADPSADGEDAPESENPKPKKKKGELNVKESEEEESEEVDVKESLMVLKKELQIRDICESINFKPTTLQRRALMALGKEKEVREVAESFKSTVTGGRFNSSVQSRPDNNGAGKGKISSTEDFVKGLR